MRRFASDAMKGTCEDSVEDGPGGTTCDAASGRRRLSTYAARFAAGFIDVHCDGRRPGFNRKRREPIGAQRTYCREIDVPHDFRSTASDDTHRAGQLRKPLPTHAASERATIARPHIPRARDTDAHPRAHAARTARRFRTIGRTTFGFDRYRVRGARAYTDPPVAARIRPRGRSCRRCAERVAGTCWSGGSSSASHAA